LTLLPIHSRAPAQPRVIGHSAPQLFVSEFPERFSNLFYAITRQHDPTGGIPHDFSNFSKVSGDQGPARGQRLE
jgi:hypothetical protein